MKLCRFPRQLRLLGAACCLAAGTVVVSAASIGPGAFSPGATLIDFDDLTGGSDLNSGDVVTSQYAGLGVQFSNPDYASRANASLATLMTGQSDPNVLYVRQNAAGIGGGPQTVSFDLPVARFGAFFATSPGATITLQAYSSGGTLLDSVTLTGAPDGVDFLTGFIGLEVPAGMDHVTLFSEAPGMPPVNFSLDDVRFEQVPEPAGFALAGLGLAGWLLRRRAVAAV